MSVLQSQPSLSISTNECKQKFLMNEIESMKATKDIYCSIFDQLKVILKKTSSIGQHSSVLQGKGQNVNQCDTTNVSHNASLSTGHNSSSSSNINNMKSISPSLQIKQINSHINQFTNNLQQKVKEYCSSSISQNIVNYLQIEKEEHQFYPQVIHQLNSFIKNNEKQITQREKQLQQIEDNKYHKEQNKNNDKNKKEQSSAQKDKKSTQKTISSFDFNKRVMEVVKKQITMLKLKKRKLLQEIQLKKNKKTQKQQNSQNLYQLKNINKSYNISPQTGKSQQLNAKKLSGLKINNNLSSQQTLKKSHYSKNDTSAFEKIVMVYQKQKFLNSRIQQQISKLQKKILSQRQQNHLMEEKTCQLHKQIEKLEWTKVCDSSFAPVHHKKIDRPIQLSILDRTFLKPCEQKSIEYSQMSINQSMIRKD